MSKWERLALGDVAGIKHGYAFKGEYFCDEPTHFLLLTPGNFMIGGGFQEKPKFYNGPIPESYVLAKDDLIVTMTDLSKRGDTLGYSALVPTSNRYLHNQRIGLVTMKNSEVLKEFVYWLMRTWDYQRFIINHASGSTVKHTSPKTILSYEFAAPPIEEQRIIVATLSAIDDKIANNRAINHRLEQMAQAIFKSWFVDFEPWGGKMPDDWREGTISDLGDVIGGSTPSKAKPEYYAEHGIAWITPKDLSINKSKFIARGANDITEFGLRNSNARLMPPGAVLFSSRAPIGYIAVASGEVCTNQGFKSIVPKETVGTAFVYCFLIENLQTIESMASGSTFKEVSGTTMKGIPAAIPTDDTFRRFQEECTSLFEKQELLEAENARLAALRDTLLPRLMSGELSVADAGVKR
ncbi:MAG: restriction endonuclease subunit S [Coriobacteriales bacterium]|nr:restriction endonuclease subunit S [Coriobacteriales bacterium]